MVKFEGNIDADLQAVSSRLVIMNQRAELKVAANWVEWKKIQGKHFTLRCPHSVALLTSSISFRRKEGAYGWF